MLLVGFALGLAISFLPERSLRKVGEVAVEVARELAKTIVCSDCGYVGTNPEEHQAKHREWSQSLKAGPAPIKDERG